MARIENHKYNIQEAFRENFYIVPDYQREFVWTSKEVTQLLDDINDAMESSDENEYFVGTILVTKAIEEKRQLEVIDGQQRLTTFFLLLVALRRRFNDLEDSGEKSAAISELLKRTITSSSGDTKSQIKLEPQYENASELFTLVIEKPRNPEELEQVLEEKFFKQSSSVGRLKNAYETIYEYLETNYSSLQELSKYWGFLSNHVIFIQILSDMSSALKIFETINDRGIGLNPMDLLKNLLFRQVKQEDFPRIKKQWKKVTGPLEENKEKPLRFLRYFVMANYLVENDRRDGILREEEIYDWFVKKENAQICDYEEKPFDFIDKLARDLNNYINYINLKGNDGETNKSMESLGAMCGGAFRLHHILLIAASPFPKPLFDHFIEQLESFLFHYIFTKTTTKELERSFAAWAEDVRSIASINDKTVQKLKYNTFIENKFRTNVRSKERELYDAMMRYTSSTLQKYRTKYLLAKLSQFVDMAFKGQSRPSALDVYDPYEIEHILPVKPNVDLREQFEATSDLTYEENITRLGNLTLLEKPINIVAGRAYFSRKKEEYSKSSIYLTSSIATLKSVGLNTSINRINEKLQSYETWNEEDISRRQVMLYELSKEIWVIEDCM